MHRSKEDRHHDFFRDLCVTVVPGEERQCGQPVKNEAAVGWKERGC